MWEPMSRTRLRRNVPTVIPSSIRCPETAAAKAFTLSDRRQKPDICVGPTDTRLLPISCTSVCAAAVSRFRLVRHLIKAHIEGIEVPSVQTILKPG